MVMVMVMMMTNDELFRDWGVEAWKKEVLKNMPAAKAVRQLKAGRVESRKALASARRSLAAQQASNQRKLNQRLEDIVRVSLLRREAIDREFEAKRWDCITRSL